MPQDKPAKEGFDPASLLTNSDDDKGAVNDGDPPADEKDEGADADELSLEELDASLRKQFEDAFETEEGDADDDDAEPDPNESLEDRVKRLEAERKADREKRAKAAEKRRVIEAGREMLAVIKEFRLTKEQHQRVVRYFVNNPDLEGSVPFRDAAIRVLGLGDRAASPASDGRWNGSPGTNGAQVISRGGGGPAPKAEPFKPVAERGNYANVTAALMRNPGVMRKIVSVSD